MTEQKIISLPNQKVIEEEAALWVMRLDDDGVSAADKASFRTWYHASEQNKAAFDQLLTLWGGLDSLPDLTDLAASDAVVAALNEDRRLPFRPSTRKFLVGAIAASFALMCVLATSVVFDPAEPGFERTYQTKIGQQQTVDLPDGSTVILNTGSRLSAVFTSEARSLTLESGEAFFDVAHDKTRPFSVETKSGLVTAVGTAFSVRVHQEKMDVVVTEGRVALAPIIASIQDSAAPSKAVARSVMEITAGQTVAFAQRVETLDQIEPSAIERRLDWRDGVLAFKGEPLEQVISDISRYTDLVIDIDDAELRQQPIGGYFEVGETEALFEALAELSDLQVEWIDERHVKIARAQ